MGGLQHNRLETAGTKPTAAEIKQSEIVINEADKVLYSKDKNGTVISVGGSSLDDTKVLKTGDTMTGDLEVETKIITDTIQSRDGTVTQDIKNLDATTVGGTAKDLLGIGGEGYSYVSEPTRVVGTTYTNTYGKPIIVRWRVGGGASAKCFIDDVQVLDVLSASGSTSAPEILVPNTSTYRIDGTATNWFELK